MKKFEFAIVQGAGSLPVHVQIRNHIEYAIGFGELSPGTRLSSVRELASTLNVAPNTVARAYQDLQDDGLLVTRPGRGTFVAELTTTNSSESVAQNSLKGILQPAIVSATAIGYSRSEIRQAVDELLTDRVITTGLVAVNERLLEKWTDIVTNEFSDLGVEVIGLLLQDLKKDLAHALALLEPAHHVFSLVNTYPDVRGFLHPHGKNVSILLSELGQETQQALNSLPETGAIGLVCSDLYASSLLGMLSSYVDLARLQRVASHDRPAIRALSEIASVIVHTFDAQPGVEAVAKPGVPLIALQFVPEPDCFAQLYQMLQEEYGS